MRYRGDIRKSPNGKPWIVLNMITSVDGATTTGELSGALGGPADREVFMVLRSLPDAILVGAGTMHNENYGPPRLSDEARRWRTEQGLAPLPRIAVVSGNLSLTTDERAFTDPDKRPWIITKANSDDSRREALSAVADVIIAGRETVDLADAIDQLGNMGMNTILCEGGPSLNGTLFDLDLVDEICWTIAPSIVGGNSRRLISGAATERMVGMRLDRILEADGYLFMRYVRG